MKRGVRDVARLANVSIGTVSNVMNRPELVSIDTVQRVEEAMAQLGYEPGQRKKGRQVLAFGQSAQGKAIINQVASTGLEVTELDLSDPTKRERFIHYLLNNKSAVAALLIVTQAGALAQDLSSLL